MKNLLLSLALVVTTPLLVDAQISTLVQRPEFKKVDRSERSNFLDAVENIVLTSRGMEDETTIDNIPTVEIRARLQKVFGDPTQKLDDLVGKDDFRPGNFIQFEYWFMVNDSLPLMILDVDGPKASGLVYGGASRYVDLMPQVKREFSRLLMQVTELGDFRDIYYDIDEDVWLEVAHQGGKFATRKIDQPPGFDVEWEQ